MCFVCPLCACCVLGVWFVLRECVVPVSHNATEQSNKLSLSRHIQVQLLLAAKAVPGNSEINAACATGAVDSVSALLAAAPAHLQLDGCMVAASRGQDHACLYDMLVRHGADVNEERDQYTHGFDGRTTALATAVHAGNVEHVRELLRLKADPRLGYVGRKRTRKLAKKSSLEMQWLVLNRVATTDDEEFAV